MPEPSFYEEGNEPRANDARVKVLQKILGAIREHGISFGNGGVPFYTEGTAPRKNDPTRKVLMKILGAIRS